MIPQETKQTFLNAWQQLTPNARELGESHFFHQNINLMSGTRRQCYKVYNTSTTFNMNLGGDKMLLMGPTTTHRNFHITGLPPSCEHGDSIGQTKDVMVYARGINHE